MTNTPTTLPTRQAIAAKDRSAPRKVTGRLRAALIEMVWKGSRRAEAAQAAGMTDHSLREALRKPHVKAFYLGELGTLRESTRAKNFHRLDDIAETSGNDMARVAAVKAMEAISDEQQTRGPASATPGITIVIRHTSEPKPAIDVTPSRTIAHEPAEPEQVRRDAHGDPIFDPRPKW
jgi:hypothetical protein